jgi:hypothetical protein
MRILVHSAPPWAQSGYGLQCRYLAETFRQLGHEVAISAFAGVHEAKDWNGFPILPCGSKLFGDGIVAGHYKAWRADLLVILGDLWVMDTEQFKGLNLATWVPIDCEPLGVMDKRWLSRVKQIANLQPIAMSEFGRIQLEVAGFDSVYIPHVTTFTPSVGKRVKWRHNKKLPENMFIVGKVGVNNEDDRKAFSITLQAFARFAVGKSDVGLYLHTEAQAKKAYNLAFMALDLGLAGPQGSKIAFADEYLRGSDQYDQDYMESMYNGLDVLDATSRGEGFGCPIIDALACGTPVIGSRNSAISEKIKPDYGWLVGGQFEWARHHHAWWQTPSVEYLFKAYEQAYKKAKHMRAAAAAAGSQYTIDNVAPMWKEILDAV